MTLTDRQKYLLKIYREALGRVKAELMTISEKYGNEMSYGQLQNLNRLKNLNQILQKETSMLAKGSIDVTNDAVMSLYETTYTATVNKIPKEVKEVLEFGLFDKKNIEYAVDNKFQSVIIKNINNLQQTVNEEISIGLIQGKSYENISKKITERFTVGANSALKVIKTETHKVVNKAQSDVFNEVKSSANRLGFKVVKKWLSAKGARTRDEHVEMNGKIADDDGYFTLPSGVRTKGPGLSGIAADIINCRCSMITEIIEEK